MVPDTKQTSQGTKLGFPGLYLERDDSIDMSFMLSR